MEKLPANLPSNRKLIIIQTGGNLGFAGGNNVGIRYALSQEADYILLLNNDTIVDSRFLEPLINVAEKSSNMGVTGPNIYYYDKPAILDFAGGRINFWNGTSPHIGKGRREYGNCSVESAYQEGSAMLIKKQVFKEIGLFDESYFLFWEDTDFCCRAKKACYKIMCIPESRIWHKIHASSGGSGSWPPVLTYHNLRSKILFMRKHASGYHWPIFLSSLSFLTAMLIGGCIIKERNKKIAWKKFDAIVRGLIEGFFIK